MTEFDASSLAYRKLNAVVRAVQGAASFFGAPIAVLSLVDADETAAEAVEAPADGGWAGAPGAAQPPVFQAKPAKIGNFEFCVSAPLRDSSGKRVGALRVMDYSSRHTTANEIAALQNVADSVSKELQLIGKIRRLEDVLAGHELTIETLRRKGERLEDFLATSSDMTWELDAEYRAVDVAGNLSLDAATLGKSVFEFANENPSESALWALHEQDLIAKRPFRAFVFSMSQVDGSTIWLEGSGNPVFDEAGIFRGYRGTNRNISKRKKAEQDLAFMARHDAVTGLLNRIALRERIEHRLTLIGPQELLAIFCMDLDDFKIVNDTFGRSVGDRLLRAVADRLTAWGARETDTIASLGGNEFAVIHVGLRRPELAGAVAQRILELIAVPHEIDGHQIVTNVSIGIAVSPNDGVDPDLLLKSADIALYRAKADGRGTYRFFEPEMDAKLQERHALEQDLREALANDEFVLHYQPILDARTAQITCFEALIRWNHPRRGLVAPLEFIPLAEDTDLIVPIGKWVIETACSELSHWPDHIRVAVNLSVAQFKDPEFANSVREILANSGQAAGRLELEITESLLLKHSPAILKTLRALHALGVGISMDDFGTGFSSLTNLRSFPFSKIKIDQSFICDLPGAPAALAILRVIVALGVTLGMETIAEGVETEAQYAMVTAEGCDAVQGYYFHRPMPAAEAGKLVGKMLKDSK